MSIILKKGSGGNFTPHPETENPVSAVIVDVTPPKERQRTLEGKIITISEIKFVYETEVEDDEGKRFCVWSPGYRIDGKDPLHEKSRLRQDLKKILGRDLTAEELGGFNPENVMGASVRMMIEHDNTERGTFARISLLKKHSSAFAPSGKYIRVKDREQKDAGYNKAGVTAGGPAVKEESATAGGGGDGWENTKVHLEGYNGLPLSDLDLETIEKLVKEALPELEAKEKKSIADKRLIAALQAASQELAD